MLVSLLSWVYIGMFCVTAGICVRGVLGHFFAMEKDPGRMSITGTAVFGLIWITVYAEIYSLFDGVGALCHLLLLALTVLYAACSKWARRTLVNFLERTRRLLFSWEGLFLLLAVLAAAFFTSRGTFHADTGIYHAQAIRIIEDYGVIKGAANLQLHFGYNSSYLVFCAFFTMRWLTGTALHTTTGFLFALLGCWSLHGLLHIRSHPHHGADFLRIAILIYILTNLYYAMSPATDYGTLILALYLTAAFVGTVEHRPIPLVRHNNVSPVRSSGSFATVPAGGPEEGEHRVPERMIPEEEQKGEAQKEEEDRQEKTRKEEEKYLTALGLIAMGGLFLVSMKLSAAALFLLAVYPLVSFLKRRQWGTVGKFIVLGIVIVLPYLARNVILTGWLFYPVSAIDLFDVEWKVPLSYLETDAAQIKVWGRCLYDVDLVDLSVFEWFPTWWEEQQHYAQMLIYADLLSLPLFQCDLFLAHYRRKAGGEGVRWEMVSVVVMLYAGLAIWFFTAPFVRYGLAFILGLPLLAMGLLLEDCLGVRRVRTAKETLPAGTGGNRNRAGFWRVGGLWISLMTAVCFCSWIDNYVMDDLVFIKQNLTEPYYIAQKPFDDPEMEAVELAEGVTVYYASSGEELNSYYTTPSTCYQFMLERTELIGDTIEEGFKAK